MSLDLLTLLPAVPVLGSDTFDEDVPVWLQAWKDSLPEVNGFIAALNLIISDIDHVIAASNFKGRWSDLSGALNKPASVTHNGATWLLLTNLANVAASEPADGNANWARAALSPYVSATDRVLGRVSSGAGAVEELTGADLKTILALVAADVGLGNLPNYGIASQAEAQAGVVSNKLMTPERTAQAIGALVAAGWTQIGSTVNVVTTQTVDFTSGLTAYKDLTFILDGVGLPGALFFGVSANGGTNWSTLRTVSSSVNPADGVVTILRRDAEVSQVLATVAQAAASPALTAITANSMLSAACAGGINAVRFSTAPSNMNNGTIMAFGR